MTDRLRRQVLKGLLLLAGLLGGSLLVDVWTGARRFSETRWQRLVPLDELPETGVIPLPQQKVALILEQSRLAAISLECTHLGCLVTTADQGFYCPCHGSEFGPRGEIYNGPATRNLPWHRLRLRHDAVWFLAGSSQAEPFWHPRKELKG